MKSFKDPSLKDAKFFLDLLDSLKPGYVDYSLVYDGRSDEECKLNGMFIFSTMKRVRG
jgi:plastin-1